MITQLTKNSRTNIALLYNLLVITLTYFLIRLTLQMKRSPKNLQGYDGICIKINRKRTGCPIKNFGHDIYLVVIPAVSKRESRKVKLCCFTQDSGLSLTHKRLKVDL